MVKWGHTGQMHIVPKTSASLLSQGPAAGHLSFERWAEDAPWKDRGSHVASLMEQLLQYVELDHPVPFEMCKNGHDALLQVAEVTDRDCYQALGGKRSSSGKEATLAAPALVEIKPQRQAEVESHDRGEKYAVTGAAAFVRREAMPTEVASAPASRVDALMRAKTLRSEKGVESAKASSDEVSHLQLEAEHSPATPSVHGEDVSMESMEPGVFKGLRDTPAFVVDVSVFSYDLDALEVRLHELSKVTDLFALIEMPVTHRGHRKPLVWARNKDTPRFHAFKDRVLHVVADDHDFIKYLYAHSSLPNDRQERNTLLSNGTARMQQMLQSLLSSRHLKGRELVVNFGHADEIPSARNMALVKKCQPSALPIDSGTWMPMGRFDRAAHADGSLGGKQGFPFTFSSSSFQEPSKLMERSGGGNRSYLLGGWQLSAYAYPPHALLKQLTCASCDGKGISQKSVQMLQRGPVGVREFWQGLTMRASASSGQGALLQRSATLDELRKEAPYREHPELLNMPNVMQCNPERFEAWYGHYDRRLHVAPADMLRSDL